MINKKRPVLEWKNVYFYFLLSIVIEQAAYVITINETRWRRYRKNKCGWNETKKSIEKQRIHIGMHVSETKIKRTMKTLGLGRESTEKDHCEINVNRSWDAKNSSASSAAGTNKLKWKIRTKTKHGTVAIVYLNFGKTPQAVVL